MGRVGNDTLKAMTDSLITCVEDSDVKIRDASAAALGSLTPLGAHYLIHSTPCHSHRIDTALSILYLLSDRLTHSVLSALTQNTSHTSRLSVCHSLSYSLHSLSLSLYHPPNSSPSSEVQGQAYCECIERDPRPRAVHAQGVQEDHGSCRRPPSLQDKSEGSQVRPC